MVWTRSPVYFYQRNDIYYFSRAVPKDLQARFNKRRVEVSLKTKSADKARSLSMTLSDRLERYWDSLRLEQIHSRELGLSLINADLRPNDKKTSLSLDDALRCYQSLKGAGKGDLFFQSSSRNIGYLKDCLDNKSLKMIETGDSGKFRDYLFERGLSSSSVKRVFSSVRAIVGLAIKENGIEITNPFVGTFIPDDQNRKRRLPVPGDVLTELQRICFDLDDEPRWLIALLSDTGMRLAEAVGLLSDDINLDGCNPHIKLKEHPWRSLKTRSSIREVPLVGASLWAAERIKKNGNEFAFPKYCTKAKCNANSASAALNKWLKPRVPARCVVHSFRHSLRDRLREVECPSDVVDAIGGWSTEGVGQGYGKGYGLDVRKRWMQRIV